MKKNFITKAADVNLATSGDNVIVTPPSDKKVYVWKLWLVAEGAVNLKFSHSSSYFNARALHLTAEGANMTFAYDDEPYFKGAAGETFGINLSGNVGLTGQVYYTLED